MKSIWELWQNFLCRSSCQENRKKFPLESLENSFHSVCEPRSRLLTSSLIADKVILHAIDEVKVILHAIDDMLEVAER